jgi:hypothetical protein
MRLKGYFLTLMVLASIFARSASAVVVNCKLSSGGTTIYSVFLDTNTRFMIVTSNTGYYHSSGYSLMKISYPNTVYYLWTGPGLYGSSNYVRLTYSPSGGHHVYINEGSPSSDPFGRCY